MIEMKSTIRTALLFYMLNHPTPLLDAHTTTNGSYLAQDGKELLFEPTANLCPSIWYIQHCYMQEPEPRT